MSRNVVWYVSLRLRRSGGIVILWDRPCSLKSVSPTLRVVFLLLSKASACNSNPRQTGLLNFLSIKDDGLGLLVGLL